MLTRSRKFGAGLAATATCVAAAGLMLGAGTSAAEPVTLELGYKCPFPLIGVQPIKVVISADLPATAEVGVPTPAFDITAVSTVPETATQGLTLVGAKTVEGTALADSTVDAPQGSLDLKVPTTVAKTQVPASGPFEVVATGAAPSLTFSEPGKATITVGNLLLTLTPRTADGAETGLGTFDSACTQDPGQNPVLATIEITGEGGGTTPTQPTEPTTPTEPTEPTTPTEPTEPTEPAEPTESTTPTAPSESGTTVPPPSGSQQPGGYDGSYIPMGDKDEYSQLASTGVSVGLPVAAGLLLIGAGAALLTRHHRQTE